MSKPNGKPHVPHFSSGPCAKRPGWSLQALSGALLARSHRAAPGKKKLKAVIDGHRELLGIPADYKVGIVPASDTGAIEMAMWSLLGARGVDVLAWENFGLEWLDDVTKQLRLPDIRTFKAEYGALPDLTQVDTDRDVVFTWNGTTSGVRVPNGDWIKADRAGLTLCDATSAVFAYDMPWDKLDVVTWSWQKVIGGEAAHGMIVLSPRAVERLTSYTPAWPLPKIFRMTKGGKFMEDIFEGATINTPSMLCVEDCLDALAWVRGLGGAKGTIAKCAANFNVLKAWVDASGWATFLATDPATLSHTSVCLVVKDPAFKSKAPEAQEQVLKTLVKLLEDEGVALDIASYRDAPKGLRIWAGATVEQADLAVLTAWLDWAYAQAMQG